MPETAQHHRGQQIESAAHAVAAERDVDVVADPGAQAHVPAPPELLQVRRPVRPVEVLRHAQIHRLRQADRHVAVAREIVVDPPALQDRQRHHQRRGRIGRLVEDLHVLDQEIGNADLLEQTANDPSDSGPPLLGGRVVELIELRNEVREALDRAGRQGREENREHREVGRPANRLATVHPHFVEIVDELEGEERDAERRGGKLPLVPPVRCPHVRPAEQQQGVVEQEARVLVERQGDDQEDDHHGGCRPRAQLHGTQRRQVGQNAEDDDRRHPGAAGEVIVEHGAAAEQPVQLQPLRDHEIDRHGERGERPEPGFEEQHRRAFARLARLVRRESPRFIVRSLRPRNR